MDSVTSNQHSISYLESESTGCLFLSELVVFFVRGRWCGPCKLLGPRLESLAVEKMDKFHLAKVVLSQHSSWIKR